jgi:energy-coupling factor transporter ATP-binding protein EcfA2
MTALRKNASKVLGFPEDRPVLSIYDENSKQITALKDIAPGATVYASARAPDDQFVVTATLSDSGPRGLANIGSTLSRPASGKPPSPTAPGGRTSSPGRSSPGTRLAIVDDQTGTSTGRKSRRSVVGSDLDDGFFVEEVDDDLILYEKTGISYKAVNNLISFLPVDLVGDASEITTHFTKLVARLASSGTRCQSEQELALFQAVNQLFVPLPSGISGSVVRYAKEIIDRATFGNSFGVFTRLKLAIVGPSRGGKSTFLRVLQNALVSRYFSSGQYKKTLLIALDLKPLEDALTDPLKLYNEIVKVTIAHLSAQRVDLIQFSDGLTGYFIKLPTLEKLVPLPQKFLLQDEFRDAVPALADLADGLFKCVSEDRSLLQWLTHVVLFPRIVALAFGFGGVHFVIDHFDAADVDLNPAEPFDADPQAVTLIEHLKFMLNHDSFTISCADEERLVQSLELLTDNGIDLRDGTEIVSIVDIDRDHQDRYVFQLTIDGESKPVNLRMLDCGGCLAFLHMWDGLVAQADRLDNEEKRDSKSRSAKELRLSLLAKIRDLSGLVLFTVDHENGSLTAIDKKIKDFTISGTGEELDRVSVASD